MSIARKLVILTACAFAALLLVGGVGVYMASRESRALDIVSKQSIPGLHLLHSIRSTQQLIGIDVLKDARATDSTSRAQYWKDAEEQATRLRGLLADYGPMVRTPKGREFYDVEKALANDYLQMLSQYLAKVRGGMSAEEMIDPMGIKRIELAVKLDEHIAFNNAYSTGEADKAAALASQSEEISTGIVILALLLIGGVSYSMIVSVRRSLDEIQRTMQRVGGELDLSLRAKVHGQDEIAKVSASLNQLLDKLHASFSAVARQADKIGSASSQMAVTAEQVAQAASEQSESAASMAAGVEEMTVSISHVGDRSAEARSVSDETGRLSSEGLKIVDETVSDIHSIAESVISVAASVQELESRGEKISSIVAVIKEVADQTNLLALNAAIEAARAGEVGNGFAVVADEVRKLAERTAGSTKEIAEVVEAIQALSQQAGASMTAARGKVDIGVQRAALAGEAIRKINAGSQQTHGMSEEIASAIREQGMASNSIASNVEKIAQMAEESSEAAKSSSHTAHELDQLAREMQQVVAVYKL